MPTHGNIVGRTFGSERFGAVLGELDEYLLGEGRHLELYRRVGAHPTTLDGVAGIAFSVWAPNARRVSVVGHFNAWDGRRHPMRRRLGVGVWEVTDAMRRQGVRSRKDLLSDHDWVTEAVHRDGVDAVADRIGTTPQRVRAAANGPAAG